MRDVEHAKRKIRANSLENANGCWIWQRSKKQNDYGVTCIDGRVEYAHRVSCIAHHGPIPLGWYVCHTCDTPSCVNPSHIYAGTPKQNQADSKERGRMRKPFGINNKTAKLTDEIVRHIRSSPATNKELGERLGVDASTISVVRSGKTWRHVT